MGLIQKLKEQWNNWYYHDFDDIDDDFDWELDEDENLWNKSKSDAVEKHFDKLMRDPEERNVYVAECLNTMADASEKMEQCDVEYEAVTSLLMDMEIIEGLSREDKADIKYQAKKIEAAEKERRRVYNNVEHLNEADLDMMERLGQEIPEGIDKIREAEKYRVLVKQDLRKLSKERSDLKFKKRELMNMVVNARGISTIIAISVVLCIVMLLVLQYSLGMNVTIGYVLAGGIGAVALVFIYVKYLDSIHELEKVTKNINHLITVHNTVKIRYINNTNLLQYYYMKFNVDSSTELEDLWNVYEAEIVAYEKEEKLKDDLAGYYNKLIGTLSKFKVVDPDIWIHQCKALYDHKEMVEVRHALIARRQKLREQMEYNKSIALESKESIASLAKKYPEYSKEISAIIGKYEGL